MARRYFVESLPFFALLARALGLKAARRAMRFFFPIALAALAVSEVAES